MILRRLHRIKKLLHKTPAATPTCNRVYIPFDLHSSIGGPATFLKNLHTYIDKIDLHYAHDLRDANLILFPIAYDLHALKKFKKRGGMICQRLDGIYYPEKHGQDYVRRNAKIKEIYLNLADHVIFQSEYSRIQCFDMLGARKEDSYTIITNGVNSDIFFPDHARTLDKNHVHFCTTGNIRNLDMLGPVIKALDIIRHELHFSLHVVGPIKNEECAALMQRDYIVPHGECDMNRVANILRASDIFIYSHLNPPCPNSVLEAIATGLPVVGYNSGALAELLFFSKELLADAGNKIYHQLEDFHPDRLADRLLESVRNHSSYRTASLQASENYSMDICGSKYVAVINDLLSSHPK